MHQGEAGDEVLSMLDVLEEDNELEQEANAVLGDSDDQCCTYTKGYVNRQALYACNTCTPTESAGLCLACSLTCHEGHELYELYTKRNFRCDCGNSKFEGRCKLHPDKDEINSNNNYNQNFRGVYCTCHKPYPDLDDEIEDEMIQCIVCEDWYHSRHLSSLPPANGVYQEMICDACMTRCTFLQAYLPFAATSVGLKQQVVTKEETDKPVDVVKVDEKQPSTSEESSTSNKDNIKPLEENGEKTKQAESQSSHKENDSNIKHENGEDKKEEKTDKCECKLIQLQKDTKETQITSSYWNAKWRSELCSCESCKELYDSHGVLFLLDAHDTMLAYEERGKESQAAKMNAYESGMQALGSMGRINQVEAIHGYNDMKNELTEYLREFAEQGKIVTPEDIKSFFENMQSRKRQRTGSANVIQYQCK